MKFKKGDRVKHIDRKEEGVITRISDKSIHVKYDNDLFEKFHYNPIRHNQTPKYKLTHI